MSRLVLLYAKNANETSPGTYTTQLHARFLSNITSVGMKSATFLNLLPNIFTSGDHQNNEFDYTIDAAPFTATIAVEGYYTVTEVIDLLVIAIQAQLDISSPGDVVSTGVNDFTGLVQFTVTGSAIMTYESSGSLNQQLGNVVDSGNIAAGVSYEFTEHADLRGLKSVTISIKSKSPKTLLNLNSDKSIYTNSLGMIPVNVGYQELQGFQQEDLMASRLIFTSPEDMTSIQFKARGDNGDVLTGLTDSLVVELKVWF